jgi:hypothetical protein
MDLLLLELRMRSFCVRISWLLAVLLSLSACSGTEPQKPPGSSDPSSQPDPSSPPVPSNPPSQPDPSSPPVGTDVTPEQRMAALDAVVEQFAALQRQQLSPEALNAALAQWLAARPEFEAAGVDTPSSSVWARFKDGRLVVVPNNRALEPKASGQVEAGLLREAAPALLPLSAPPPLTSLQAPSGTPTGQPLLLPETRQVRLLNSFGPRLVEAQKTIDDMASSFRAAGYTVVLGTGGEAPLADLHKVSGDAFFFFNTHGGTGRTRDEQPLYCLQSSTVATDALDKDAAIKKDLDDGLLVYMVADTGDINPRTHEPIVDKRYAITHRFVEQRMQFGKNSFVFLNACRSVGTDAASQLFFAMHKQHASVYLGWEGSVNTECAYEAVSYMTDRLLGANTYAPEATPQRPFHWLSVLGDMWSKGLGQRPRCTATLKAQPASSGPVVGVLVPSLRELVVDEEHEQLSLRGIFGEDPRPNGKVTIGGGAAASTLDIVKWTPQEIITRLPSSGPSWTGEVVVTVGGLKSNPRSLLGWHGVITYTETDAGSLTKRVELLTRARFDSGVIRIGPGQTPNVEDSAFIESRGAMAVVSGTGSYAYTNNDCRFTHSWSGSEPVELSRWLPAGDRGFAYGGILSPARLELELGLWVNAPITSEFKSSCGSPVKEPLQVSLRPELFTGAPLKLSLDEKLNILPGSKSVKIPGAGIHGDTVTATLAWEAIPAQPAYDPMQPK